MVKTLMTFSFSMGITGGGDGKFPGIRFFLNKGKLDCKSIYSATDSRHFYARRKAAK